MLNKSDLGRLLRDLRKSRKMTQEEVAQRVDITRSTISNYEIGRRMPHLHDLRQIADVFGVGLDYFGISAPDDAFDLLIRAKRVFESDEINHEIKEELFAELLKLYLELKGKDNE